jgi:uncharacterized HAD superfamily protein
MPIGIDCDEVLFPLLDFHLIFLNRKYNINLTKKTFTTHNFWEHYKGTREQAIEDFFEFTRTPEFLDVKPFEGAVESVKALKQLDNLIMITARQYELREKTEEWTKKYFGNLFSKIVLGNAFANQGTKVSKRQLCSENNISLLLEDSYDNAFEVSKDIPVILFNRPWNELKDDTKRIVRVYGWKEAVDVARKFYSSRKN